jgi:D-xylose transport system substrate-binding protein
MLNRTLIFIAAFGILLSGCVTAPEQAGEKRADDGKIIIGFSMDTLKEHWVRDRDLVTQKAKELGAEVIVSIADGNEERQIEQVDDMLTRGIDVLIMVPHNAKAAAAAVEKAKANNVPVVSYDRLILSDKIDVLVSHLHSTAGQMQAEYALKNAPKGNYVMVYGPSTDNNAAIIKEAQMAVLKPAIDRGDIKIVAEQNAANWAPEEALKIAENALTQNQNNIVAVVASNDGTAGGAIQALNVQGLKGKVVVTGMDAQLDALQRIAVGEQSMTVYKPIKPLADAAVEAAVKLAKGEKIMTEKTMKAVNKEIPFVFIQPIVVDKSNLMLPINDGAESYDDVYRNVPEAERPPREK